MDCTFSYDKLSPIIPHLFPSQELKFLKKFNLLQNDNIFFSPSKCYYHISFQYFSLWKFLIKIILLELIFVHYIFLLYILKCLEKNISNTIFPMKEN